MSAASPSEIPSAPSSEPRRSSLLVLFLTVFIDLLGFGIVLPLLPIYARTFLTGASQTEQALLLGLLMSSFSAMQFLFSPLWGRLSDRIGRRPVLMAGLTGSVIFYGLFAWATVQGWVWLLFVSRIGAGIAGATIATAQAYIADSTTLDKRHKGMALIGAAFGLGFTLGPLIGWLAVTSGDGQPGPLPGVFASLLSLFALVLAFFRLPESLRPESVPVARGWFDWGVFQRALRIPSVGWLLFASFICVFSFGSFESTLALLITGGRTVESAVEGAVVSDAAPIRSIVSPFAFDDGRVFYTFAYVGLVLTLAQGLIVRRLSGKVSEGAMGGAGAMMQIAGLALLVQSVAWESVGWLYAALGVIVAGFALMTPSINSLISRRTPPSEQGRVLGLGQSISALARIVGPVVGIRLLYQNVGWPYWFSAALMAAGGLMIVWAAARGRDYPQGESPADPRAGDATATDEAARSPATVG